MWHSQQFDLQEYTYLVISLIIEKNYQYSVEYFKLGFTSLPTNEWLPYAHFVNMFFPNEAMKPSRLSDHFTRKHGEKLATIIAFL